MPSDCFSNLACFTFPISCASARLPRSVFHWRDQRGEYDRLLRFAASSELMRLINLKKEEGLSAYGGTDAPSVASTLS